jgi:hypothetical protein
MESTDNNYLLLALNHGVIALGLFVGLMAMHAVQLTRFGSRRRRDDPSGLLAFTLIGCYLSFFVSLATVYQGMQSVQMFFLIAGWSEGLLVYGRASATPVASSAFRRVVA